MSLELPNPSMQWMRASRSRQLQFECRWRLARPADAARSANQHALKRIMRTLVILILIGFCLSGWSGPKPNLEMKGKWSFGPKETGGGTAVVKWVSTVAVDGSYHRLLTLTTSNKVTEMSETGILELKNGWLTETMTNLQFPKALPWVRMQPLTNTNRMKIVEYDGTNLTLAIDVGGTKKTVIWRRTE